MRSLWRKVWGLGRLAPGLAVAVAVALLLAGLAMAVLNEQQVRSQKLREVSVQAEILAGSVAGPLAFDDRDTAREYVSALRANRDVEAVGVYDAGGRLAAGYAREGSDLPKTNSLRPPAFDGLHLIVTRPVVQGTTALGSVYLRTVTEPLPRRLARYAGIGLLILMAALVVAVFGASNASITEANRKLQVEMVERARAEAALRRSQQAEAMAQIAVAREKGQQSEQQLELALQAGRLGSWAFDLRTGMFTASEVFRANFGIDADGVLKRYADLLAHVHPDDRARQQREMDAAIDERTDLESEYRTLTADGETRWVLVRGRATYGEDGAPARMTGVSLDVTARKSADERMRLLLDELNHRVKNTLASVQSIAIQTSRTADAASFEQAFLARIAALARAHDLLTEVAWDGASLKDVIARTLAPYLADGQPDRVEVSGPNVRLSPNAAVSLTMAFHELATNAGKYGSLSAVDGRVAVAWKVDGPTDHPVVEIDWRETGGPPVSQPIRRGFGSRLVEKGLAREFDGQVELTFAPGGVRCHMRLPLSRKMQLAA
jgi:PAS domain S-box-containing protein